MDNEVRRLLADGPKRVAIRELVEFALREVALDDVRSLDVDPVFFAHADTRSDEVRVRSEGSQRALIGAKPSRLRADRQTLRLFG